MTEEELQQLGSYIVQYCKKFNVPLKYLSQILEDQKVSPMIRGKATEYNVLLLLESRLPKEVWSVHKLNLNPQPGIYDEDISVTHRRTGVILKIESKNAVRGSMRDGKRSRKIKEPHFKVKCHRSRSNIRLATSSNDRYAIDSFDILVTNPLNAIYQGNTIGEELELIQNQDIIKSLYDHYQVSNDEELKEACKSDWRFCIPQDIAEEGFIPRTPYVKLCEDLNWRPIAEIENRLLSVVKQRRGAPSRRS